MDTYVTRVRDETVAVGHTVFVVRKIWIFFESNLEPYHIEKLVITQLVGMGDFSHCLQRLYYKNLTHYLRFWRY